MSEEIHAITENNLPTASFVITFNDDGVYLKIFLRENSNNNIEFGQIIDELKRLNTENIDAKLVSQTILEANGIAVRVGTIPAVQQYLVDVLVSRDRMEANLLIHRGQKLRLPTLDEVKNRIQQAGVSFGIDYQAIDKALAIPGNKIVFASGQLPVNGQDAYIRYHFDMDQMGKPTDGDYGRVDYKNLNLYINVHANQLLAEKIPRTLGISGYNVLGQAIIAQPGKDKNILPGKNTRMEENTIIAVIAGHLVNAGNRLEVIPIITINGDVDLSTGNVDFTGNIVIKGSIMTGFSVKADGDVEVYGNITGAIVEGKNITIKMGIHGMNSCKVVAQESIKVKFVQNAILQAGTDIIINSVIMHSSLKAGRRIIISNQNGLLVGGKLSAGEEIDVPTAGTELAPATNLEVGVNPALRDEYKNLRRENNINQNNLLQTKNTLNMLNALDQSTMPPEKTEMMLRLTKIHFKLAALIKTQKNRLDEIENIFKNMHSGKIKISRVVHPGTTISIGTTIRIIRELSQYVQYYLEDGEIKISPYK